MYLDEFRAAMASLTRELALVSVSRELDPYTAGYLQARIEEAGAVGADTVLVDLFETSFLDSAALAVLVRETKRLEGRGHSLNNPAADRRRRSRPGRMTATTSNAVATKPSLLFFHSASSGRCRRVEGFLAQVLQRRSNHDTFELLRVDADEHAELIERFTIETIPTLVVVADKRARGRLPNPQGCRDIERFLAPWLR